MKILQVITRPSDVIGTTDGQSEMLPSGESISRAIVMGGKSCCGAAYRERPQIEFEQPSFTR